jgi:ankyrin repeat protein
MASAPNDRSGFIEPLPAHPSFEMQQKRAKELLRAAWKGDASALARVQALHPRPPESEALTLADAQLVIARGYGFESWAAMKRKIESLTRTPVEQFVAALYAQDVERVRALLDAHAEVRAAINAPIGHFDSRPVMSAARNLPLLDLLIAHGADINLKTAWWAGGFGILEYDVTPADAPSLIARGATVDVFAAAHLGMFDRLRELVSRDPSLVHARGGDGKTALHYARSLDLARYLVERGADVDARCVDHESTPAQYLVRDAPDVTRYLVECGARVDIFMAVALGDRARVARSFVEDPDALNHRIGDGQFRVRHDGKRAATPEEIGDGRGDIYRWVLGHYLSPIEVARRFSSPDIVSQLLERASPIQRLLAACAAADRVAAERLVADHPGLLSQLTDGDRRLIADRAYWNDTAAVALMVDLGFDGRAVGHDGGNALQWAARLGNTEMVRALLKRNPPIGVRDATYHGAPIGWCVYGALFGEKRTSGDFAGVLELLIAAGDLVEPRWLPTGRDDVDRVLRAHLAPEAR